MDSDSYTGFPTSEIVQLASRLGCDYKRYSGGSGVPIMRLYGVTENGNSALIHVHGYEPYFYVRAPRGFTKSHCNAFVSALNDQCKLKFPKKKRKHDDKEEDNEVFVRYAEICSRQTIWHYQPGGHQDFIRVVMVVPNHISAARGILESGIDISGGPGRCTFLTYESNVSFVMRYMVDAGIVGASWVTLPRYALCFFYFSFKLRCLTWL
jgi:DNA polymerase delta subunit 1